LVRAAARAVSLMMIRRGVRVISPISGSSDLSMGDGWTATGVLIKA
jgi:hypothetical protein